MSSVESAYPTQPEQPSTEGELQAGDSQAVQQDLDPESSTGLALEYIKAAKKLVEPTFAHTPADSDKPVPPANSFRPRR